ncbi:MAG: hypothetical protein LBU76_03905 [Azoarcus sp.]|jgi:hypothetical protein|nr:hypothetical protein [Azoarcus sp.]
MAQGAGSAMAWRLALAAAPASGFARALKKSVRLPLRPYEAGLFRLLIGNRNENHAIAA